MSGPPATTALRTVRATRYAAPLREGGSLPALVEADDDGMYVVKLRGAGQGPKALVAELIAGELARSSIGLAVPEIAFVELDAALAPAEPDQEIQDLLTASVGVNLGLDFLPGALAFDPAAAPAVDPAAAAAIVWLDARHQRRPHGPQPQPARVARAPVADRPRGGPLPAPPHLGAGRAGPRPLPASPSTCCPFACSVNEVDEGLAAALDDGRSRRSPRWCRTAGSSPRARRPTRPRAGAPTSTTSPAASSRRGLLAEEAERACRG